MAVKFGRNNSSSAGSEKNIIRRYEHRSGLRGGLMYFAFILCLSIGLAFFAWMAASDMLGLNKREFSSLIELPSSAFSSEKVETFDETGEPTGTKDVSHVNVSYMSEQLKNAGLINYEWLFKLFCKVSNADQKVSPGEYELKSSYDYRALIQHMRAGANGMQTVDITIPEGFTMNDIFTLFEQKGVASYEDLVAASTDSIFKYTFLEGTEGTGPLRLEGYLFPDTYQFYVSMEPSSALNKLINNFYLKYSNDMLNQTAAMGLTVKDIVTIASYIEKEAKFDEDRYLVSSVVYNRLAAGMPLGLDTTILYLHQDHQGEPTLDMINEDTPYNTRIYTGLTPTPICNPGLASITAALNPQSSNYYYFYSDIDTGKLNFFTNIDEFNAYAASHPNTGY